MLDKDEINELKGLIGEKNLFQKQRILYLLKKWDGNVDIEDLKNMNICEECFVIFKKDNLDIPIIQKLCRKCQNKSLNTGENK